jgi:hypothetical protein
VNAPPGAGPDRRRRGARRGGRSPASIPRIRPSHASFAQVRGYISGATGALRRSHAAERPSRYPTIQSLPSTRSRSARERLACSGATPLGHPHLRPGSRVACEAGHVVGTPLELSHVLGTAHAASQVVGTAYGAPPWHRVRSQSGRRRRSVEPSRRRRGSLGRGRQRWNRQHAGPAACAPPAAPTVNRRHAGTPVPGARRHAGLGSRGPAPAPGAQVPGPDRQAGQTVPGFPPACSQRLGSVRAPWRDPSPPTPAHLALRTPRDPSPAHRGTLGSPHPSPTQASRRDPPNPAARPLPRRSGAAEPSHGSGPRGAGPTVVGPHLDAADHAWPADRLEPVEQRAL